MFTFFAGLRKMFLAYAGNYRKMVVGDVVVGDVVVDAINSIFIPKLEAMLATETEEGRRTKLQGLIEIWNQYADEKSRIWTEIAAKSIHYVVRVFGRQESMAEEVAQDLAGSFFNTPSRRASLERFNPEEGPLAFMRLWKAIITNQAKNTMRALSKRPGLTDTESSLGDSGDQDEESPDSLAGISKHYQTEEEAEAFENLLKEMHGEVSRKLGRDEIAQRIFGKFWTLAQDKSPDAINMKREVYEPLQEEFASTGTPVANSTLDFKWKQVQQTMLRFYEDMFHKPLPFFLKKKLKLLKSSDNMVERLAYEDFKLKMANWLIAGIPRSDRD